MAKKKKAGALPKRFAGVKIPKKVRKGPIAEFITSPAGQIVVAEVVAAAGGALAKRALDKHPQGKRAVRRKAAAAGEAATEVASEAIETSGHAGARLTLALTEAARTFGRVLHHNGEAEAPKSAEPARRGPGRPRGSKSAARTEASAG